MKYKLYRAEYEDDNFEFINAKSDSDALNEAWGTELEEQHGSLFNLFLLDKNDEVIKTIL